MTNYKNSGVTNSTNNYSLNDVLHCTPYRSAYTNAPTCGLSESEFLDNLYTNPSFKIRIDKINEQLDEIEVVDEESRLDLELLKKEKSNLEKLAKAQDEFENSLCNDVGSMLRYISGYSGSGKSTYLGYLFMKLRKQGNITKRFDLAEFDTISLLLFGRTEINLASKLTLGKFLFTCLNELTKLLTKRDEGKNAFRKRLQIYYSFYESNIKARLVDYTNIFLAMEKYLSSGKEGEDEAYNTYCERMYELFHSKLLEIKDDTKLLKGYIEVLLILYILLMGAEINKTQKLCFIAFDSIEHYLGDDEIYNDDIIDICAILNGVLASLKTIFSTINASYLEKQFRLIIALRDTTTKILPTRNTEDNTKIEINISDWFVPADIAQKRYQYFGAKGNPNVRGKVAQAINCILLDDEKNCDRLNKISTMHNQNKRRLLEYLLDVIHDGEANRYLKLYGRSEKYYSEFKKSRKRGEDKQTIGLYKNLSDMYKYAAREYVINLLLKEIKGKHYFERLLVNADIRHGKHVARKILTYIAAKKNSDLWKESDNYISFTELFKLFKRQHGTLSRTFCDVIVEVLCTLNDHVKKNTHWCQNIVIKFNEDFKNEADLKNKIYLKYKSGEDNLTDFGIKITPAGRFFLKRMTDFEYFIIRYSANDNSPYDEDTSYKHLKATVSKFSEIESQVALCVDEILQEDVKAFSRPNLSYARMYSIDKHYKGYLYVNDNGRESTHLERLIDNHIGYLDFFRSYIIRSYIDKDIVISEEECRELSSAIINIIIKYVDHLKRIVEICDTEHNFYVGFKRDEAAGLAYYQVYQENIMKAREHPTENVWIKKYRV